MSCLNDFNDDEVEILRSWHKYAKHWGYFRGDNARNFELEVHDTTFYSNFTSISDVVFRNITQLKRMNAIFTSDVYNKICPENLDPILQDLDSFIDPEDDCVKVLTDYFDTDLGEEFAQQVNEQKLNENSSQPWTIILLCAKILNGMIFSNNKKQYVRRKVKKLKEIYQEYFENLSDDDGDY